MRLLHGWFSQKQANLSGTFFYIDEDGEEVEVSSVSRTKTEQPKFRDVKFVAMVQEGRFRISSRKPILKFPEPIFTKPIAMKLPDFQPIAMKLPDFQPIAMKLPDFQPIAIKPHTPKLTIEQLWERAKKENTIESYKVFIKCLSEFLDDSGHDKHEYMSMAKQKLDSLSWKKALSKNDIESYVDYIDDNPMGNYVSNARTKIENLVLNNVDDLQGLIFSLQYWRAANYSAEILDKIGWQPQNERDRIHLLVARRRGYELRQEWDITKAVLLDDIETRQFRTFKNIIFNIIGIQIKNRESKKYKVIENALYAFIGIGKEEILSILSKKLSERGNKIMAEAYLNCGHHELNQSAREWAKMHNYEIKSGEGAHPVSWGHM